LKKKHSLARVPETLSKVVFSAEIKAELSFCSGEAAPFVDLDKSIFFIELEFIFSAGAEAAGLER